MSVKGRTIGALAIILIGGILVWSSQDTAAANIISLRKLAGSFIFRFWWGLLVVNVFFVLKNEGVIK